MRPAFRLLESPISNDLIQGHRRGAGRVYALSGESITRNSFRILGLPATASQADVDRAARRLRIWPDPSRIPPTP